MATDKRPPQPFVYTPTGRLSFPNLDEPKPFEDGDDPKFSCAILFPKGTDLSALVKAVEKCKKDFFGATEPKNFYDPIRDGDDEDKAKLAGYKGHIFLNARTINQPAFALANATEIHPTGSEIRKMFYGGCWVRLKLQPYGYEKGKNRGVAFGLCAVQFIKDGPAFSGQNDASGFEAVEIDEDPFSVKED